MSSDVPHDPFRGKRVRATGRFAGPVETLSEAIEGDGSGEVLPPFKNVERDAPPAGDTPPNEPPNDDTPAEDTPVDEDARRAAALAEAERLGVKVRSNMRTDTIERKVAEAKAGS